MVQDLGTRPGAPDLQVSGSAGIRLDLDSESVKGAEVVEHAPDNVLRVIPIFEIQKRRTRCDSRELPRESRAHRRLHAASAIAREPAPEIQYKELDVRG